LYPKPPVLLDLKCEIKKAAMIPHRRF